jgi:hypothetical protein
MTMSFWLKVVGVIMKKAIAPCAQTERPGGAGPARDLLGGKASPAAFVIAGYSAGRRLSLVPTPERGNELLKPSQAGKPDLLLRFGLLQIGAALFSFQLQCLLCRGLQLLVGFDS